MFKVESGRLWRGVPGHLVVLDARRIAPGCRGHLGLLATFAMFAIVTLGTSPASASSEPPPLIGEMRRPRLPVLAMPVDAAPAASAVADGPMCQPADPNFHDPDPILPDLMGVLLQAPASESEQRFVDRALTACEGLRGPVRLVADPFQVLALARLEVDLGVPESARGILVAAWCVETSMKARPGKGKQFLGDFRDGIALASGSFQLHENVWAITCNGTRNSPHDLLFAAGCWWSQVLKTQEKARRVSGCAEADMLRVAEAAASNVLRYGWRCNSKSAHWQMLDIINELPKSAAN